MKFWMAALSRCWAILVLVESGVNGINHFSLNFFHLLIFCLSLATKSLYKVLNGCTQLLLSYISFGRKWGQWYLLVWFLTWSLSSLICCSCIATKYIYKVSNEFAQPLLNYITLVESAVNNICWYDLLLNSFHFLIFCVLIATKSI